MDGHPFFERGADGRHHLRPGKIFVHGGDVPDRFPGELRVVEELLRLKAEAPRRVVLLAGNRDLNKIRIPLEIRALARRPGHGEHEEAWRAWLAEGRRDTPANRLRFIFAKTMNAQQAFEMRRQALARRTGRSLGAIRDDDVVKSYLKWLGPGGAFRRLLFASQLAYRNGNTLYVHGFVDGDCLGVVPDRDTPVDDIDEWVRTLNRWYLRELRAWARAATNWTGRDPRPGEGLIAYSRREGDLATNPASVVYNRNVDGQGKLSLPSADVIARLLAGGVARLVVGHTPSGDTPLFLRSPGGRFEIICGDNAYCSLGEVPSFVTVEGGAQRAVRVRSTVASAPGGRLALRFRAILGANTPIGRCLADGSVVVGRCAEGYVTFQMHMPGWRIVYEVVEGFRFGP